MEESNESLRCCSDVWFSALTVWLLLWLLMVKLWRMGGVSDIALELHGALLQQGKLSR